MSYDLHFYRKKESNLSNSDLWTELKRIIPKNISKVEGQIEYENKRTGVYFLIDLDEPNTDKEVIEIFDRFDDFINTNITASINFLRPDYFALEIFPLIYSFVDKLDLYIFNEQEFDESRQKPIKWTDSELINHWTAHNELVSKQQFEELQLRYYSKDKSDYLWSYTNRIEQLEEQIKDDIYIPNAFIIQNRETKELFSYIVWNSSIPLILPRVDFVILIKKYKKLFQNVEEIGIAKYQDILDKFTANFEIFDSQNKLLIPNQMNADKIRKDFNSFPIWRSPKTFGPQIGLDNFVNHK